MALAIKVKPDSKVSLKDIDPENTNGISREKGLLQLADLGPKLTELEETHAASGQHAVAIVLQGLDTSGKDGTIRHVMAHFNPASCRVESFKVPTPEERAHDFLWRIHRVTPASGTITIFNRSHYEDVLVTRVQNLISPKICDQRYTQIKHFEEILRANNTIIIKFYLHISKEEQRDRLLAREQDHERAWKLSTSDWPTHALFDSYVEVYQDAINHCTTEEAPWYIIPANHKWYRNLAVAQTILDVLEPYRKQWKAAIEERGRQALAARAAQRAAGEAPTADK